MADVGVRIDLVIRLGAQEEQIVEIWEKRSSRCPLSSEVQIPRPSFLLTEIPRSPFESRLFGAGPVSFVPARGLLLSAKGRPVEDQDSGVPLVPPT